MLDWVRVIDTSQQIGAGDNSADDDTIDSSKYSFRPLRKFKAHGAHVVVKINIYKHEAWNFLILMSVK